MKQVKIEATQHSPKVELNPTGEIKIQGRCIIEDSVEFFAPLFLWVNDYNLSKIEVEINLEYINTSSVKQLYSLLQQIKANRTITNVYINWYYEEGDDDMLELGQDIESQINMPFDYYECAERAA
jgi:hypothetical protein